MIIIIIIIIIILGININAFSPGAATAAAVRLIWKWALDCLVSKRSLGHLRLLRLAACSFLLCLILMICKLHPSLPLILRASSAGVFYA